MRVSARVSFRDVAQLVAHYVRDGMSVRVRCPDKRERLIKVALFFAAHGGALEPLAGQSA